MEAAIKRIHWNRSVILNFSQFLSLSFELTLMIANKTFLDERNCFPYASDDEFFCMVSTTTTMQCLLDFRKFLMHRSHYSVANDAMKQRTMNRHYENVVLYSRSV